MASPKKLGTKRVMSNPEGCGKHHREMIHVARTGMVPERIADKWFFYHFYHKTTNNCDDNTGLILDHIKN